MRELPSITASGYASNTLDSGAFMGALGQAPNLAQLFQKQFHHTTNTATQTQPENTMAAARIIKVFVADPNENLPLEQRVLYSGEEKLTDLTDQELFFEVPINDLLKKHNAIRVKTIDKAQAAKFGRDITLEEAKIRDLKMVVVTVATF